MISMLLSSKAVGQSFVQTEGTGFILDGAPYQYVGVNLWYAMHLGSAQCGDRDRLRLELDRLRDLGITNLRLMASAEGPDDQPWRVKPALMTSPGKYQEHLWEGLDFVLYEMSLRDMKAVVTLNNFWPWSGGMAQYVSWSQHSSIPYPPPAAGGSWVKFMLYTSRFYDDPRAKAWFRDHVTKTVNRCNTFSGMLYKEDPTIMSWQLANEPRGMLNGRAYRKWIHETADYIRSIDDRHLISLGSEGFTSSRFSGTRPKKDHRFQNIDYVTAHVWVENWGWYDPMQEDSYDDALSKARIYIAKHATWADAIGKPFVLEEFGIARDRRSYDPLSPTLTRDRFFSDVLASCYELLENKKLAGLNVWSWAGSARPALQGGFWQEGDALIGDPPHEHQGWYSIYDSDLSTLDTLRNWSRKFVGKEE